ncbi:helix-turn-helix transcriptional regulator [Histidinibacterium aquaticum]|uniref:LuxR family transcriptional regulator n=1 Tax=Histidinibacterium aquaticum TaxID=2613962 RepID=A0A5J5GAT0_9RHOB|nr:LuxR family transcriptional regulator [Histidinibacterium aquaticum]KAA9005215.1 LuxR family transcriptional regulator [Histidinibacterium aquaticum]
MADTLNLALDTLQRAGRLDDLQDIVERLRGIFGVDHCVYHWVSPDGEQYGCGTYSRAWCLRYLHKDYLRIDPVVLACYRRAHPLDWRELDWSPRPVRAFLDDARAHGVGTQGYSVPVRGPSGQFAVFTLSSTVDDTAWDRFTRERQRDLILFAHYFNSVALSLAESRQPEPARALSPREADALTYLAMGYGRGQVANLLSISEHTLRAYIEGARVKLGALNTMQAVSRAVAEGLIVVGGARRAASGQWPALDMIEVGPSGA